MMPWAWLERTIQAIGLAGQAEIVGVFALAAHQRVVFLAADRLADTVFLQCDSVFEGRRRRVILHGKYLKCPDLRVIWRVPTQITHRPSATTPDWAWSHVMGCCVGPWRC